MTRLNRVLASGGFSLLLIATGWFIWPTPYRDFALRPGNLLVHDARVLAARQNRVTRGVDVLTRDGWRPLNGFQSAIDSLRRIAADPLDSLLREFGERGTTPDEAAFRAWKTNRLRATMATTVDVPAP